MKVDLVGNIQPSIKVDQVLAAAQEDVLAIVYGWAVIVTSIQRIRSGASSKERSGLEQRDVVIS